MPIDLSELKQEYIDASVEVENAHLWSPEDPYLYDISFQLLDKDRRELDRETIRWGIREFIVRGRNFYLNNKKYILRGINHVEDHPDVGASLNPRLIYNDLNIMKEANINCIRTLHHPPYKALIELADEMGFMIIEDLPVYGLKEEHYNKKYLTSATQQLWEMIHRDKTHCSVVAWVLADSCEITSENSKIFIKNLVVLSRELDPHRLHTFVIDDPNALDFLDIVDFIAIKSYIGWYDDKDVSFKRFDEFLEQLNLKLSEKPEALEKPIIISEFGAGAISGYKDFSDSHWTENYQYDLIYNYIRILMHKEFIGGVCISNFQDYRSSPYGGYLERPKVFNNMGIVDMHRNPKNSYYALQNQYSRWIKKTEEDNKKPTE